MAKKHICLITPGHVSSCPRIIAMGDEEIRNKQRSIQRIYPERFTYDAVGRWITKCASDIQRLEQASTMVGSRGDFRF